MNIIDSEIRNNTMDEDSARGAGLHTTGASSNTLIRTSISGNSIIGDSGRGAGIHALAPGLVLDEVTLHNNSITGDNAAGAGLYMLNYTNGTLTMTDSTVTGNTISGNNGDGAGVYRQVSSSPGLIAQSVFSDNVATGNGGAIYTDGQMSVQNSTIVANSASDAGGGIYTVSGIFDGYSNTITGNSAGTSGGGVHNDGGVAAIGSSIISGNSAPSAPDIASGSFVNDGSNLIGTAQSDLLLHTLQDNGGPTETIALLPGSTAINAIALDNNDCAIGPSNDQRGESRGIGGACDIGAYEAQYTNVSLDISAPATATIGTQATVTITLSGTNLPADLLQASSVMLTGHGSTDVLSLDSTGQASTTVGTGTVGPMTLNAIVGTHSTGATINWDVAPAGGPTLYDVPGNITVPAMTPAGAILEYTMPTADDPVDGPLPVTCLPGPNLWFPVGSTTVDCSATNSSSDTTTESFTVEVTAFTPISYTPVTDPSNQWFYDTWARTDLPVSDGSVTRTWMWGPGTFTDSIWEPYTTQLVGSGPQQIPSSEREVVYFDKARMEINDPGGDPNSVWFVTNGLLVVEMITGNRQFGDDLFLPYDPSYSNIAGDADDLNGPTYAAMQGVLNAPAQPVGTLLTEEINRYGNVTSDASWGSYDITVGHVDTVTDHGIAEPFWTFMNSQGLVYEDGDMFTDDLFLNPFYATGRPITEAYWANVLVAGTPRDVLLQCFERRCLTYTPGNSPGFVVEAGNVGQHYYHWRYVQAPD